MTNRRANFINMVDHLSDVPQKSIQTEKELAKKSPYRQAYHIESESGSLGDPNGFSYFNQQYHLFYQWSPLSFSQNPHYTHHGWKHLVSKNLVDWEDLGAGIESDTPLDKYGTYSGSAISCKDKLFLMYTGNTWTNTESADDWRRVPYQVGAWMDQDNKVKKLKNFLLKGPLAGYTGHFRDPKIFKKNDVYYAVVGIQRENLTGGALLVKSKDLYDWNIINEIKTKYTDFGYMWECPDYFELDNYGILEFCPQGLKAEAGKYENIYQNGYLIGSKLNLANGTFNCGDFHELDKGFDFYAMQTMKDEQNRRILMAWMGLPETKYPTEEFHYTGCMIFPRELKIRDNQIVQEPVKEIENLYQETFLNEGEVEDGEMELRAGKENSRDIKLTLNANNSNSTILDLFADEGNQTHLRLIFNYKKQEFIVNRAHCGIPISEEYGVERKCKLDLDKKIEVRILQDISSAEIFLNNGKDVFSMRVFTNQENNCLFLTSNSGITSFKTKISQLRNRK